MQPTARIERRRTPRTDILTAQILLHRPFSLALPTQHGFGIGLLVLGPDLGFVIGQGVVAGDAGVVLVAALVADGDDVAGRMPVGTLGEGGHGDAMDGGWRCFVGHICGCVVGGLVVCTVCTCE